jgi:hypothetical protein
VQIPRSLRRRLRARAHRGAGILGNEIDAQPGDNSAGVVFVETVQGQSVVEQGGHLVEHLTSDLEVHLRSSLGDRLCGGQKLIERWVDRVWRHDASLPARRPHRQANMALGGSVRSRAAAGLIGDAERYLARPDIDPMRDGASYSLAGLWLDDLELLEFVRELYTVVQPRAANGPRPGRTRRILATVLLPGSAADPDPAP